MKKDKLVQELIHRYGNWVQDKDKQNTCGYDARMTQNLFPYEHLFSPIQINHTTIKNRIVMAPMGNIDMCEETGRPNDRMLQYFFTRAKGGTGLLTTGLIPISHGIDPSVTESGHLSYFPRIDRSRTVLMGWRDLAQGVHTFGSKIFVQLTAGLGRVGNPQCLINEHKFPVSASFNPNFYISQIPCVRLSDRKLKKIIKNTGQAAADAQFCGIDGVYLHGHEGYLLEQITNPAFNRRKLGAFSNYQRFGLDMVKEIRRRVGPHYPIMYRIDLSLALNETYGEEGMAVKALRKFKNGRTVDETLDYMKNLVAAGVDMFDVDLGCYDNWWLPHPPSGMPAGCFLPVSQYVKAHFKDHQIKSNAGFDVPIVAVGKLGYPDLAEQALRDQLCDMIMLGRPLLADPEWPNKAFAGKVSDILPCINCQEGCINEFVEGGHPQCAVNPRTSFEHLIPAEPVPAQKSKKIAVIGAGPAGATFALTAIKRGHQVDLYEKTNRVGGKIIPGSVPRIKFDIDNYLTYLESAVQKASEGPLLSFHKNTEMDLPQIQEKNYDSVIFAVGTKPISLSLPGQENMPHASAISVLSQPKLVEDAKHIVVIGGGVVGCETAYFLSYEHQKQVSVIEMQPHFMEGVCTANRGHLIYYLKQNGVRLINLAQVKGFSENAVHVVRNVSKNAPDPYNTWQPILPKNIENPLAPKLGTETKEESIPADFVVFAIGEKPQAALYFEAQAKRIAPELYNIGDSFSPGKVLEAVRAAYNLALKI